MTVLRYAAFTTDPTGGNPAGVVLDATGLDDAAMQRIAAEVGYSETAFLFPRDGISPGGRIRYFSSLAEVPFCGHATIAAAVAYAEVHGPGELQLATVAGPVAVRTRRTSDGLQATLTSVATRTRPAAEHEVSPVLSALGWLAEDLDPALPSHVTYAGAEHLVLGAGSRERLADLDYDFNALAAVMAKRNWTTVNLVWREAATVFHSRNPFPPGGVVEDPATGAAAAALGGYLRELGLIEPPVEFTVHQGEDLGRPSLLLVGLEVGDLQVRVTGNAVKIPQPGSDAMSRLPGA